MSTVRAVESCVANLLPELTIRPNHDHPHTDAR